MASLSPRTSHYAHTGTPDLHHQFHVKEEERVLQPWEKVFEVSRVLSYFFGSALFLAGSVFFYPKYSVMGDGQGGVFGSWAFVIGCVCFFSGANLDFITMVRFNHGGTVRRLLRAYNALCYFMAASIFILGALYFLPTWYPKAPELGCYSFIIGSILFCVAALVDIAFICMTHDDPNVSGFKIGNIVCWGTIAALGTFIGALLFTIGSFYYLPEYISVADAQAAEDNMYRSINYYTIGSVFFVINSLALIPDVSASFRAGKPDQSNKMCAAAVSKV
jgi:phosphate/sulfate permease